MKTQTVKTDCNIKELEMFFNDATLPPPPIKLNVVCHITNVRAFVDSHIELLKANEGKETFLPYLKRLEQLRDFIINSQLTAN